MGTTFTERASPGSLYPAISFILDIGFKAPLYKAQIGSRGTSAVYRASNHGSAPADGALKKKLGSIIRSKLTSRSFSLLVAPNPEVQALPIGNPDPVPKPQFRKTTTHRVGDARGLSGADIAGLDLKAREALARKQKTAVTPRTEDKSVLTSRSCRGVPGWYHYHISYS
jgi:hypothetical protein